jgi:hypothetical protein
MRLVACLRRDKRVAISGTIRVRSLRQVVSSLARHARFAPILGPSGDLDSGIFFPSSSFLSAKAN